MDKSFTTIGSKINNKMDDIYNEARHQTYEHFHVRGVPDRYFTPKYDIPDELFDEFDNDEIDYEEYQARCQAIMDERQAELDKMKQYYLTKSGYNDITQLRRDMREYHLRLFVQKYKEFYGIYNKLVDGQEVSITVEDEFDKIIDEFVEPYDSYIQRHPNQRERMDKEEEFEDIISQIVYAKDLSESLYYETIEHFGVTHTIAHTINEVEFVKGDIIEGYAEGAKYHFTAFTPWSYDEFKTGESECDAGARVALETSGYTNIDDLLRDMSEYYVSRYEEIMDKLKAIWFSEE